MKTQSPRVSLHVGRSAFWSMAAGIILAVSPGLCEAGFVVGKGYDLFQTWPGTTFLGQQFRGVTPYYGFYFGYRAGYHRMGDSKTSMIVERLGGVQGSANGTKTVKVQLRYFKLRSTNQINLLGNGKAYYYVSLQRFKASTGTYAIHFNSDGSGGTFDASITLRYVVRKGPWPWGRVVMRGTTTLSLHQEWMRKPGGGYGRIKYANWLLNGRNTAQDFFPFGYGTWTSSDGNFNILSSAASPFRL